MSERIDLSIVIPTQNRSAVLSNTLMLLGTQTYPHERFEAIVVDDGSHDDTERLFRALASSLPYRASYIRQERKGPSAARNRGVAAARGEKILFIGDDIYPRGDLIERHLSAHRTRPGRAVLGFVDWPGGIKITDFMRYISPDGFQFRYSTITDIDDCGWRHFYTSNISLDRSWLTNEPFDEDFPYAAMEDNELAYRLEKKGLKVVYEKSAIGYHCHLVSFESFRRRMKLIGFSAAIMVKKHPELKRVLLPVDLPYAKALAYALHGTSFLRFVNKKFYWWSGIVASYIEGFAECEKMSS